MRFSWKYPQGCSQIIWRYKTYDWSNRNQITENGKKTFLCRATTVIENYFQGFPFLFSAYETLVKVSEIIVIRRHHYAEKSYEFIMRIEYGGIKGSISDIAWVARHPLIFIRDLSTRMAIVGRQKFAKYYSEQKREWEIGCFQTMDEFLEFQYIFFQRNLSFDLIIIENM